MAIAEKIFMTIAGFSGAFVVAAIVFFEEGHQVAGTFFSLLAFIGLVSMSFFFTKIIWTF